MTSGIGSVYSRALDGLITSQKGISVISNNIANVNTPGYARQQLVLGTRASFGGGANGGGVFSLGITSFVNPFVERQLIDEKSNFGLADGRRLTMSFLEDLVSDANGEGIGSAMSGFFNSWSQLAQDPSNNALRQGVRESGQLLGQRINSLNNQFQQLRGNLSNSITATFTEINSSLEEVARLNGMIQATSDQASILDLKNARNLELQNLSEKIGINFFENADGIVNIQVAGTGFPLVTGANASTLSGTNTQVVGGIHSVKATIPGSSENSQVDITSGITSGSLGGLLLDRNTTVNNRIRQLDELAYNLSLQVNTAHQNGFGIDGSTGNNFFAPAAAIDGAAASFGLDNAVINSLDAIAAAGDDPANTGVGDSDNASSIIDLQNQVLMNGGTQTFSEFVHGMQASIGIEAAQVNSDFETRSLLVNRLQVQRENISGVNMDEEAVDLIKFQRAFEGAARVMQAANVVLDTLLEL